MHLSEKSPSPASGLPPPLLWAGHARSLSEVPGGVQPGWTVERRHALLLRRSPATLIATSFVRVADRYQPCSPQRRLISGQMPIGSLKETLAATSRRRGPRAARSSLLLHLHRAMRPPTEPRSQGRKVLACRRPGMCAAIDSALRQAAGSPAGAENGMQTECRGVLPASRRQQPDDSHHRDRA